MSVLIERMLPDAGWPEVMEAFEAAAYFSLQIDEFLALGIQRAAPGLDRWDRVTLDRYADDLSGSIGGRVGCARCTKPVCGCPDPLYAGVIDDSSEPGSWARVLRHRGQIEEAGRRFHALHPAAGDHTASSGKIGDLSTSDNNGDLA